MRMCMCVLESAANRRQWLTPLLFLAATHLLGHFSLCMGRSLTSLQWNACVLQLVWASFSLAGLFKLFSNLVCLNSNWLRNARKWDLKTVCVLCVWQKQSL